MLHDDPAGRDRPRHDRSITERQVFRLTIPGVDEGHRRPHKSGEVSVAEGVEPCWPARNQGRRHLGVTGEDLAELTPGEATVEKGVERDGNAEESADEQVHEQLQ